MNHSPGPITLKGSDSALEESEARFRHTFENAAVGMALVSPDGRWLKVNRRFAEIVGYTPEEMMQQTFQDITHPDDLATDLRLLREAREGKRDNSRVDKRYIRKDGSVIWVNLTVGCVRKPTGEIDYLISVVQDINDQKRTGRALEESETRFQAILQASPEGFIIFRSIRDAEGRIVDFLCEVANPAAAGLSRMEQEDMIGHRMLVKTPINKEVGLFEIYCDVVETGKTAQGERRIPRPGGEVAWFRYAAVKVEDGFAVYFADITARKRAERDLRDSEARFRAVQQTTPDGFGLFRSIRDESGTITDFRIDYLNPAAAHFMQPSLEEMLGGTMSEFMPGNYRTGAFEHYVQVVETGETWQGDVRYPLLSGEGDFWFRATAAKVDDGVAISYADITATKQTELSLKESEARFRAVQQTSPDAFMIYSSVRDGNGEIIDFRTQYVNPALERVAQAPASEIVGCLLSERVPPAHYEDIVGTYVRVVETGLPWQGEIEYEWPIGKALYRATAAKVGDGFAISFVDITERKATEIELRERDQRLRAILDNVLAYIGLLSPEGTLLEINELALHVGGVERSDVIGKPFWETYWWSHSSEIQDQLKDAIRRALKGERVRYDVTVRTAGDERSTIDFQLAPIMDENGWVTQIVPSGYDISDRKQAEQHREMLLKELSHRVKNSLATVQTIASHTLREATDLESFREAFVGRLMAISKCHDLLVDATRRNASLAQLVRDQVLPYARAGAGSQVSMSGPIVTLSAEASHTFGLVLHELATNAAKYGALSTGEGHLDITWQRGDDPTTPEAIVEWTETGGPLVSPPERRGFGSVLIEQSLAYSLGGSAHIEYRPEGLYARFRFPKKDRI